MPSEQYPPSFHQSRHRFPLHTSPPRFPYIGLPSQAHLHWPNNQNYSSNYHEPSFFYGGVHAVSGAPRVPQNHSYRHSHYPDESNRWTPSLPPRMPSTIPSSSNKSKNSNLKSRSNLKGIQLESMDLSSSSSKSHAENTTDNLPALSTVNGDVLHKSHVLPQVAPMPPSISNDIKISKNSPLDSHLIKESVSVITTNPLRDKISDGSDKLEMTADLSPLPLELKKPLADCAPSIQVKTPKQVNEDCSNPIVKKNIPVNFKSNGISDQVESALESMFHVDKLPPSNQLHSLNSELSSQKPLSVINAQICRPVSPTSSNLKANSLEQMLKSPSLAASSSDVGGASLHEKMIKSPLPISPSQNLRAGSLEKILNSPSPVSTNVPSESDISNEDPTVASLSSVKVEEEIGSFSLEKEKPLQLMVSNSPSLPHNSIDLINSPVSSNIDAKTEISSDQRMLDIKSSPSSNKCDETDMTKSDGAVDEIPDIAALKERLNKFGFKNNESSDMKPIEEPAHNVISALSTSDEISDNSETNCDNVSTTMLVSNNESDASSYKLSPRDEQESNIESSTIEQDENVQAVASPEQQNSSLGRVVETNLEKLFAGIVDENADNESPPASAVQMNVSADLLQQPKKTQLTVRTPTKITVTVTDEHPSTSKSSAMKRGRRRSIPASRKKPNRQTKDNTIQSQKEVAHENVLRRVPLIHIEGPRENPVSVTIINSGFRVDAEDGPDAKTVQRKHKSLAEMKAIKMSMAQSLHRPDVTDESWVCIFCGLGPNAVGIAGDACSFLYGPYFLKRSQSHHSNKTPKKKKRFENSVISDEKMEVWGHENCFIWASGVCLLGSSITGLDGAVHMALETICTYCKKPGAATGCCARKCKEHVHYSCALASEWQLDIDTFKSFCHQHRKTTVTKGHVPFVPPTIDG